MWEFDTDVPKKKETKIICKLCLQKNVVIKRIVIILQLFPLMDINFFRVTGGNLKLSSSTKKASGFKRREMLMLFSVVQ